MSLALLKPHNSVTPNVVWDLRTFADEIFADEIFAGEIFAGEIFAGEIFADGN